MKLSIKALIYSAIVFPGAGYFILNKSKQGLAFIIIALGCLALPMYEAFQKAQIISEKIVYGYIPMNIISIRQEIESLPGVVEGHLITSAYLIIIVLWLIGLIDCYRIGKTLEKSNRD